MDFVHIDWKGLGEFVASLDRHPVARYPDPACGGGGSLFSTSSKKQGADETTANRHEHRPFHYKVINAVMNKYKLLAWAPVSGGTKLRWKKWLLNYDAKREQKIVAGPNKKKLVFDEENWQYEFYMLG